jgi:hypothetical protein
MEDPRLAEKKAIVRRYVDEYQSEGRNEVADELLSTDFIHHSGPAWVRTMPVGSRPRCL